jgi:hypothetical protein
MAEASAGDGVYGRLDSDIGLEPGVGITYSRSALLPEINLGATYLSTVGLRLRYADSKFFLDSVNHNRCLTAFGFEVRPLFMARWSEAWEKGPAWLDLTIDSFLLGMGVFWDYDRAKVSLQRGAEFSTGFGVPLFANDRGPWLRATAALRLAEGPRFSFETQSVYALTLGWNLTVNSGLHNDME